MRPTQLHLTAARLSRAAYLGSPEAELGANPLAGIQHQRVAVDIGN